MKRGLAMALCATLLGLLPLPAAAQQVDAPRSCQYIRGFKRLHDLAPDDVGACTSRRIFAGNGDVLQYTTNGMMVRRGGDNWTAFTNGYMTFIDGPRGLVTRLNADRFDWERDTPADQPAGASSGSRVGPAHAYPNPALTPGATNPRVTQRSIQNTICSASFLAAVQPAASYIDRLKRRQIGLYAYADGDPASYVEDHFVPVELGGDPDAPSNLWPQPSGPAPAAVEKDEAEQYLHDQVCSGALTLAAAQAAILNDWVAVYQQLSTANG
jgi:hypothetical protein